MLTRPGKVFLMVFTDQEARRKLAEILQRPEFTRNDALMKWLQSVADGLSSLISRITGKNISFGSLGALESVIALASAMVVLFIIIYIMYRLYRFFSPEYSIESTTEQDTPLTDEGQLRSQASACAEKGEYRQAIRYLYLSLLLYLDKKQLICFRFSKTNHEYLQEFQQNVMKNTQSKKALDPHTLGGLEFTGFSQLVSFFEGKWYGMEPCTCNDYEQFQSMYLGMVKER